MIIKVDDNTYINYNDATKSSQVVNKEEYETKKDQIETRLDELDLVSDEALLAWAKKNYPTPELVKEKASLENELVIVKSILEEIKEL
jgi:hypothetical protein